VFWCVENVRVSCFFVGQNKGGVKVLCISMWCGAGFVDGGIPE
jgi:hypothetical protein